MSLIAEHFLRAVCALPGIRGRVLLTTRLLPRALEQHAALLDGCRDLPLTQLDPADAVAFFRSQGIRGTHAEIESACDTYGYHPLSLRLLAGLVAKDPQQPGDIAAARRYDVTGDLVQRRNHVLAQAYDSLTLARRKLLSRIACLRGAVGYDVLRACALKKWEKSFEVDLRDLLARGLLQHDRRDGRYDLHPIVRRYAYERMGSSERTAAHVRLRDYFAAVPPPSVSSGSRISRRRSSCTITWLTPGSTARQLISFATESMMQLITSLVPTICKSTCCGHCSLMARNNCRA